MLQSLIQEVLEEFFISTEAKKKKQNATRGNTWHEPAIKNGEPNPDGGRFTDRSNAGSWSLQFASKNADCGERKCGVARVSPSGNELFVKGAKCGRENEDGGKAPRKCSVK